MIKKRLEWLKRGLCITLAGTMIICSDTMAFAAEAALINAFNYVEDTRLTNIVAGHHSAEALTVDDFEKI